MKQVWQKIWNDVELRVWERVPMGDTVTNGVRYMDIPVRQQIRNLVSQEIAHQIYDEAGPHYWMSRA